MSVIWSLFQSKSTLIADTQWDNTDTIASPLGLSIHHKIPEISVRNQMERTILVRSYRNIRGYLWRWSTLTIPIISISRTEMCLFISALFVSCLQITKRVVAWVGSVQTECTVWLGTWNFRIFKPKFLSNESGLGTGIINRVTVLPPSGSLLKVAEHSFGSFWVYVICQIMAREGLLLTSWNLESGKYIDERFWVTGKIYHFRCFHGNMNDWILP